jgi:hypothetical protein
MDTMRYCDTVALSSLARYIRTTPKRLRRLVDGSTHLEIQDGRRVHMSRATSPTASLYLQGLTNRRTGNDRHLVRFDSTYVVKRTNPLTEPLNV